MESFVNTVGLDRATDKLRQALESPRRRSLSSNPMTLIIALPIPDGYLLAGDNRKFSADSESRLLSSSDDVSKLFRIGRGDAVGVSGSIDAVVQQLEEIAESSKTWTDCIEEYRRALISLGIPNTQDTTVTYVRLHDGKVRIYTYKASAGFRPHQEMTNEWVFDPVSNGIIALSVCRLLQAEKMTEEEKAKLIALAYNVTNEKLGITSASFDLWSVKSGGITMYSKSEKDELVRSVCGFRKTMASLLRVWNL